MSEAPPSPPLSKSAESALRVLTEIVWFADSSETVNDVRRHIRDIYGEAVDKELEAYFNQTP